MDYTLVASDLITEVIQEGEGYTTNRNILLNYLNRIHQRILRESQWAFLKSERQSFITVPGVQNYWVGATASKPNNYVDTNLNLTDFDSLLPDSVEDNTEGYGLVFDSNRVLNQATHNPDNSEFIGPIRSFSTKFDLPGGIQLHPVPSNQNMYQPIPSTPYVGHTLGGYSPTRTLFITCTFVDSIGGESLPCTDPAVITVPPGNLVTIQPPLAITSGSSGITYARWNVYVGYSLQTMTKQNTNPLSLFVPFVETAMGFNQVVYPDTQVAVHPGYFVGIDDSGQLTQVISPTGRPDAMILSDSSGNRWQLTQESNGITSDAAVPSDVITASQPYFYIQAPAGAVWQVTVLTNGLLASTFLNGIPGGSWNPGVNPPTVSTLAPMYGDLITFRYMQHRKQLGFNDTLQVPTIYRDVVMAGLNYYSTSYLKTDETKIMSSRWLQEFNGGLAQIRRDLRLSTKTVDMILPDNATQYTCGF